MDDTVDERWSFIFAVVKVSTVIPMIGTGANQITEVALRKT